MTSYSAREVVDLGIHNFSSVVNKLGFDVKRGRAACQICGAHNPTTCKFNFDRGAFHCFRCDVRGGVLDLVEGVIGCSRSEALRWLAGCLGVTLRGQFSRTERVRYARSRATAAATAEDVADSRERMLTSLREARNDFYRDERLVSAIAQDEMANPTGLSEDHWDFIWSHALDHQKGDELHELIEEIENGRLEDLIEIRRRLSLEATG